MNLFLLGDCKEIGVGDVDVEEGDKVAEAEAEAAASRRQER